MQSSPEHLEKLRNAIAEYEGARRRVERDAERRSAELRAELISELLPVLDNIDRSIAEEGSEGMQLVRAQLEGVLRGYGLERFDAVGQRFDPRVHEAMDVALVDQPEMDGVVVAQWQPGYRIADRVLRPARVQVGKHR